MNVPEQKAQLFPSYRTILLSQGQFTVVSAEDYEFLSKNKWYAMYDPKLDDFYAVRNHRQTPASPKRLQYMHKVILGLGKGQCGDHANGQTLHNVRENLRPASAAQNMWNRPLSKNNTSGFKGTQKNYGRGRPWIAIICISGKRRHLGYFDTAEEAGSAYQRASEELHGEFRRR